MKTLEKQLQQKKDSDPIMAGMLEEVRRINQTVRECPAVVNFLNWFSVNQWTDRPNFKLSLISVLAE